MSDLPRLSKQIPARQIPARQKTVEFTWIAKDFMKWSIFYDARKHNRPDKCWWCSHPFGGDEMLALAGRSKKVNVLLCQDCAASALEDDDE